MTHPRDNSSLSHLELVVLARLSKSEEVSADDLSKAVREICLPDSSSEYVHGEVFAVVTALRQHGLVSTRSRRRTDAGAQALRTALGLAKAPNWKHARALLTPLPLGFPPAPRPAADPPLSRIELVVLARLSKPKSKSRPVSEEDLARAILELCLPDASLEQARAEAANVVIELRQRGFVSTRSTVRTDIGARALRAALGLAKAPNWDQVPALLAALALGFPPESEAARLVATEDALAAAVLCEKLEIPGAATSESMCDALIAEALGMPPGATLSQIRAHVLADRAERIGIDLTGIDARREPADLAADLAAVAVNARKAEQSPLANALARRWVCGAPEPAGSHPTETQPAHAMPASPAGRDDERSPGTAHAMQWDQPARPDHAARQPPAETVLEVVRETLPRVGADGRFGAENVFVSAIWHRIQGDRRLVDLSFDRFKRWLVNANRDGWLVLARADLVGAMDPRQVAESEIEDRGATFHFVLDLRAEALAFHGRGHA